MENSVELLGHYGGDLEHALSAWCSTSRELTEEKRNRIDKLLLMLASSGHETPFEKSSLHFLITTDIATHIHLLKHRIGTSINSECLSGDNIITFVNINNNSEKKLRQSLSELYYKWNNGRSHQNTHKDCLYNRERIKKRRIRILNEDTGFYEFSHIKNITSSGIKQIYKITLKNGQFLKCSENHRILTKDGYKTLADGLKNGSLIAINGITTNIEGRPHTFISFFEGAEDYTRKEFAKKITLNTNYAKNGVIFLILNLKKMKIKILKKIIYLGIRMLRVIK